MDFLFPLLGGAVGAAVINGIVGYLRLKADRKDAASQWQREQEHPHESWVRDKKQEAYTEFLEEVQTFIHRFSKYNNERGTTVAEVLSASGIVKNHRLLLLASSEVRTAQKAIGLEINRARWWTWRFGIKSNIIASALSGAHLAKLRDPGSFRGSPHDECPVLFRHDNRLPNASGSKVPPPEQRG
jgi:hypothetical protein